jgi:acetyltransferase-like isoleucine patch superfamily enzyme
MAGAPRWLEWTRPPLISESLLENSVNYIFPYPRFEAHLHFLYRRLIFGRRLRSLGRGSVVNPFAELKGMECISIGSKSYIGRGTQIIATKQYLDKVFDPSIEIGDNVSIGKRCIISTTNTIRIENSVTIAEHVYIAGGVHEYSDPEKGILDQPLVSGSVTIAQRVWIGYGAFIAGAGDLSIGEHAIVGANSVVTRSVPPFTIVAGCPAKPIKRYDPERRTWTPVPKE